jgi:hypothetical protein
VRPGALALQATILAVRQSGQVGRHIITLRIVSGEMAACVEARA